MKEFSGEQLQKVNKYYINIKKIWDKPVTKQFSSTLATLFLIAFFLFFALKPTIETIFTLNKKIADAREVEKLLTQKINNINSAYNTYQEIQTDIPLLNEYLPLTPETSNIDRILLSNSQTSEMHDLSYSLGKYEPIGGNGVIEMEYLAKSDFSHAFNFLENIYNARRLFSLNKISINKSQDSNMLDLSIAGNVYYEKKDKIVK